MKCDTCRYFKMCYLRMAYTEMVDIVADITNTEEPEYGKACKIAQALYDGCVNYEEKA